MFCCMDVLIIFYLAAIVCVDSEEQLNDVVSPYGECFDDFQSTFVRSFGLRQGTPAFVVKQDMVTCASQCRANFDPSSDTSFPCSGFNYRAGQQPSCEFFTTSNRRPLNSSDSSLPVYYFQKICLRTARLCEESAYSFDSRRGYRMNNIAFNVLLNATINDCMESCVLDRCGSFTYHSALKRCDMYNSTRRDDGLMIKDSSSTYFENSCIQSSKRCHNNERIEFVSTRRADVPSFGLSIGVKTLPSCLLACIASSQLFCRSSQFDATSNECFISDETSDVAVPSSRLDIYEPFCAINLDVVCNRPYVFEKKITVKMETNDLELHKGTSWHNCLQACLNHSTCVGANYNVMSRDCHLLSSNTGSFESDENFDYYELSCPRQHSHTQLSTTTTSTPMESDYEVIATNSDIKRNHLSTIEQSVKSVQECWERCLIARCELFSYSEGLSLCGLGGSNLTISRITKEGDFIERKDGSDIYVFSRLLLDSFRESQEKELTTTTATTTTTTSSTTTTTSSNIEPTSSESLSKKVQLITSGPSIFDPEEANALAESHPPFYDEKSQSFINDPGLVHVHTDCRSNGVNVSFILPDGMDYSGVLYAAERFDQCRVFVKEASQFAIFIPRPKHNSWCNAVEIDNKLSVLLIISNDRILPLHVTTTNDLMYSIDCDYSESTSLSSRYRISSEPISNHQGAIDEKIRLEITRNGQIVDSVFVGEQLVATVRSNHTAAHMIRVIDCTAHRIGGEPSAVKLIADGCALLPSLMSPMQLTPNGWQSSLSAFRIEGSEQVNVVCIISKCVDKCPEMKCDTTTRRPTRSTTSSVRIDQRLMIKPTPAFSPICLEPITYIPFAVAFIMSLVSIAISMILAVRRMIKRDQNVQQLLSITNLEEYGPKYVKTREL